MNKVPNLRFKDFSGEWEHKLLSSFATKITQKNGDYKVTNVISNSAKNGLVSQKDYFDKDIANQDNINGYYVINNGDFVYNPRKSNESPYGPINRFSSTEAGVVSPLYLCFSVNCEVNDRYLEYYFKSSKWYQFIYRNSDQGARHDRVSIRDAEFFKMKLNIPNYREQEKITSFFSLIDKKIELQTEKVEELKNYKKGIMQKIFSQELRFKDENGNQYPDWEERKLSELLYEHRVRNDEEKFTKNDVLSVSGDFGIVNQIKFLGRSYAGESVKNYHVVHTGDIVYTKSPLKSNPYGIIKVNKGDAGIVSTLYAVYSCKASLNGEYLDYYFQLDDNTNRYLRPLVHKGAKNDMKINNEHVLSDKILICSINEQDKIVEFMKVIDKKIKNEEKKLSSLNEYKKGLLQQMFI